MPSHLEKQNQFFCIYSISDEHGSGKSISRWCDADLAQLNHPILQWYGAVESEKNKNKTNIVSLLSF